MMCLSVKGGVTACIANSVDLDQARQNLDPDLHMYLIVFLYVLNVVTLYK